MKTQPLVSILIPLYNQERYFKACMRSVEAQTYKNLEIIVVNDGSTDRSPQMAKDWAARDSRVKVLDKKNEGLSLARCDGYKIASGEYVAFVDSDDKLIPNAIELLMNCAQEYDVDLVMGSYNRFLGSIITRRKCDINCTFPKGRVVAQPELFDEFYVGFFGTGRLFSINVWAKLYRKEVIDKVFQETELFSPDIRFTGEDLYLNLKLFPYLKSMFCIDEPVYMYRHGGGTFGFNKTMPSILLLSDKRLELLDQYNYSKGYGPLYAEYVAFVYNNAAQLIYFKKADKVGVIDFMKQELESRKLIPRLEEFYTSKKEIPSHVRLLLDRNYEGMYDYAYALGKTTYGSLKIRMVKLITEVFEFLA